MMRRTVRSFPGAGLLWALIPALALTGCMGAGRTGAGKDVVPAAAAEGELDVRRYLGPDYCPELRIRPGTELFRRYEGTTEEAAAVVWQASLSKTARECLYDTQGTLTLRVGISGRVVAGPKGSPGTVTVPLRIAVVRYQEAVLANELIPLNVAISGANSTVFTEVRDVVVPAPGNDRNYVLFVGFDEKGERLLGEPEPPPPVVKKPPAPKRPARQRPRAANPPSAPAPARTTTPGVLPTPSDGFVLSR